MSIFASPPPPQPKKERERERDTCIVNGKTLSIRQKNYKMSLIAKATYYKSAGFLLGCYGIPSTISKVWRVRVQSSCMSCINQ